jgi:hypothetical protein
VIGAEIGEHGLFVGEQVPDDHQDRATDGDDRPFLAAAFGDTALTLPEERVGSAGHDRRLAEDPGQGRVARGNRTPGLSPNRA